MKWIDLRSDTVTKPTKAMLEAMVNAEVGDDVYGDDPTVNELERYTAEVIGKEASLFCPSGTFANQLAVLTHCKRGDEILLGDDAHIIYHEVGAAAVIAGVQTRTFKSSDGIIDPEEIRKKIRIDDIHYPDTGLICLENALGSGTVVPLETMKAVHTIAKENNIPVHMDGARVFNAATHLGVNVKEITKYCDSLMFCLSKGLCAPIGSMLAGSHEFIQKAKKQRKLMGGGLRQAGYLAAPGLLAIKEMTKRLKDDHDNAKYLADQLRTIKGIEILEHCLDINMVFFNMEKTGYSSFDLEKVFLEKGIKINPEEDGLVRFVTNYWVTKEDIDYVIKSFKEVL